MSHHARKKHDASRVESHSKGKPSPKARPAASLEDKLKATLSIVEEQTRRIGQLEDELRTIHGKGKLALVKSEEKGPASPEQDSQPVHEKYSDFVEKIRANLDLTPMQARTTFRAVANDLGLSFIHPDFARPRAGEVVNCRGFPVTEAFLQRFDSGKYEERVRACLADQTTFLQLCATDRFGLNREEAQEFAQALKFRLHPAMVNPMIRDAIGRNVSLQEVSEALRTKAIQLGLAFILPDFRFPPDGRHFSCKGFPITEAILVELRSGALDGVIVRCLAEDKPFGQIQKEIAEEHSSSVAEPAATSAPVAAAPAPAELQATQDSVPAEVSPETKPAPATLKAPATFAASRFSKRQKRALIVGGVGVGLVVVGLSFPQVRASIERFYQLTRMVMGAKPLLPDASLRPLTQNDAVLPELLRAAQQGNAEGLSALLAKDADVNVRDDLNRTALIYAAEAGKSIIVRKLLDAGADTTVVSQDQPNGQTALIAATRAGYVGVVRDLIEGGASPNAADRRGRTPLHYAAEAGHQDVTRELLDRAANPNLRAFDGTTPLFQAIAFGRVPVVKLLLEKGANPNLTLPETGLTPLHRAVENGTLETVRMLVADGADPKAEDRLGVSALRLAEQKGAKDLIELLRGGPPAPAPAAPVPITTDPAKILATPEVSKVPGASAPSLLGAWSGECEKRGNSSEKETLVFGEESFQLISTIFTDSGCKAPLINLRTEMRYARKADRIAMAARSVTLAPESPSSAAAFNQTRMCGLAGWSTGQPKDVTRAANCAEFTEPSGSGRRLYGTVQFDSKSLTLTGLGSRSPKSGRFLAETRKYRR